MDLNRLHTTAPGDRSEQARKPIAECYREVALDHRRQAAKAASLALVAARPGHGRGGCYYRAMAAEHRKLAANFDGFADTQDRLSERKALEAAINAACVTGRPRADFDAAVARLDVLNDSLRMFAR